MALHYICHGDCEGVEIADLVYEQQHEATAEASDLGLAPGEWPASIRVDGFTFLHVPSLCGGPVHCYTAIRGAGLTLNIIND